MEVLVAGDKAVRKWTLIDRTLALQTMAARKVSIITNDGNVQFGAHVAGLGAISLPD